MSPLVFSLWLAAPTANWQRAATVPITSRQYVRLTLGDTILFNGAAGPGELRLWTQLLAPTPAPGPPARPEPPMITGFVGAAGQPLGERATGYERVRLGAAKVGEEVTIQGRGFGNRIGTVKLGQTQVKQPIVEWSDTRIIFKAAAAGGRGDRNLVIEVRLPDGQYQVVSGFLLAE